MDFRVAEPIQLAMEQLVKEAAYGYEEARLSESLADAFAEHMLRRFSWQVSTGDVLPVADLVEAQFAAVSAFSARGDGVILQTPIYPPFINSVREMGRQVVEHRLVDDGTRFILDVNALPKIIDERTPLLMLCNPHNPTGRVFERGELEAVAQIAVQKQLVVVADEVHADLAYPGHTHIPFASLGREIAERTITITSATKAYNIPGLRCGLMHFGSTDQRERFRSVLPDRLLGKVNRLGIEATITAWRSCAPWLEDVMQVLQANRDRLASFLAAELPAIHHYSPDAGFLAWLDCRALELQPDPHAFFLDEAKVALNDGAEFSEPGRGHVRLNFATSASILDELLVRMAQSIRVASPELTRVASG
jgi:cystathionine beta-lyase